MMWPLTSNCPQQLFAEPHPVDRCALFTYALTLSGLRQACPDRKKQKKEIGMLLETNVWTRAGRKRKGEPEMKGDCDMATFPCTHAETHRQASLHDCSDLRRKHDWESFTARVRPSKTPRNTRTYARIICVPLQNDTKWPNRYKSTAGAKNQTNYGPQMIFSDS